MLFQIFAFLLFIVITLFPEHCSDAANSDYVLTTFDDAKRGVGIIHIPNKSTQGNGIAFCTWLKMTEGSAYIFQAVNNVLRVKLELNNGLLQGVAPNGPKHVGTQRVSDCNFENITSWFHLCIVSNQFKVNFYLNGLQLNNYTMKDPVSTVKNDKITVDIGDVLGLNGRNISFFQANVFDRPVTLQEVKEMYKCNFIEGDIVKWTDIKSKSPDINFWSKITLEEDDVPCPNPPPYTPINCSTGEPLEKSEVNADPDLASGNIPSESTLENMYPGPSSENADQGQSSGSMNPGSSSGNTDPGQSSGSMNPGSTLGNTDQGQSSGSMYPGSNSGNTDQGQSSGILYPESSSGNTDQGQSSGNTDQGQSSGSMDPGSSSGDTDQGQSSGSMNQDLVDE